jgi:hypothetical protein
MRLMLATLNRHPAIWAGIPGAALIWLLAAAVIDHPVHYDELLHLLAARGLLGTGEPVIASGLYERAEVFTRMVSWSLSAFGSDPVSARIPAVFWAGVLVWLTGAWVAVRAGRGAGLLAALLLAILPWTTDVAVFARFYTLHAVAILLMTIAAFETIAPARPAGVRYAWASLGVLALPLAFHLQETTAIGFGALLCGCAALLALDHRIALRTILERRPVLVTFGLAAALLGASLLLVRSGLLESFQRTALWAAADAGRKQYYLVELRNAMPFLWPLFPLAAFAALRDGGSRRLALLLTVAVVSALVVHSLAAQKNERYIYYILPWVCAVSAIGICSAAKLLRPDPRGLRVVGWGVLAFALVLSTEGTRAVNLALGRIGAVPDAPFAAEPDWQPYVAELATLAARADTVMTSNAMKAIYYLGRYDVELNATIVPEVLGEADFGIDERTGGRAIGSASSVLKVVSGPGSALVVLETSKLGRQSGVAPAALSVIESRCDRLSLQGGRGDVWAWWCPGRSFP